MPTRSAALAGRARELVHRLRERPVLGHHPGRVGHELDESLPRILDLERMRGPPAARPSKRSSASASQQVLLGREVAVDGADADPGGAGDLVHLRVEAVLGELLARARSSTRSRLRRASARWARAPVVGVDLLSSVALVRRLCDRPHDKRNSDSV